MKLPKAASKFLADLYNWGVSREEGTGLPIQTGALPWRLGRGNSAEVLLVTGRNSGRWMIPKGWPMRGKTLAKAAAQEAFEEAGVRGTISTKPLGSFRHVKQHLVVEPLEVSILVHTLSVKRELSKWPEHGQRERRWFTLDEAASCVDSKELGQLILRFGQKVRRAGGSGGAAAHRRDGG